jgi:two-component system response regulator RegA
MCLEYLRELTEELTTVTTNCVLIVDDDEAQVKTCADILGMRGIDCIVAVTSKQAIKKVKHHKPILAIIDLKMPEMGGLDLIRTINKISPFTKCVILTGYISQASAIEAVNLGVIGYYEKPGPIEKILALIHKVMKQ